MVRVDCSETEPFEEFSLRVSLQISGYVPRGGVRREGPHVTATIATPASGFLDAPVELLRAEVPTGQTTSSGSGWVGGSDLGAKSLWWSVYIGLGAEGVGGCPRLFPHQISCSRVPRRLSWPFPNFGSLITCKLLDNILSRFSGEKKNGS